MVKEHTFAHQVYVLVPFYNGAQFLEQCLRSLRHQTEDHIVVLVDDGSDQDVHPQLRDLIEDEQVVLLTKDQREGPASARSLGLDYIVEESTHDRDIVVMVDGDDFLCRDRALELIARPYNRSPSVRMTLGRQFATGCSTLEQRPYRDWHLRFGLTRHMPSWRGHAPQSFQVGLYKDARSDMIFHLPDGRWITAATDMALIFPMLDRCGPGEVTTLDATVYTYRFSPEGRRHSRYTYLQKFYEFYVRRSIPFTLVKSLARPSRLLQALLGAADVMCSDTSIGAQ